jgi:hypothetical protein
VFGSAISDATFLNDRYGHAAILTSSTILLSSSVEVLGRPALGLSEKFSAPKISNKFDQENSVHVVVCWDDDGEILQSSLAKVRGMQNDNFRPFLTRVPIVYVTHYMLFYLEQKR